MYSTCLFCHADLGRNEVLEAFPVGRRLAFDAANGRLWVVCRKCERWNLTPLDERWAAIDACERLYRDTRARVSTDEIGLARLGDGTELVRIGKPLRPEFAAWRYGDQFGRRRVRNALLGGVGIAAMAGVMWGGPALGAWAGGSLSGVNLLFQGANQLWFRRHVVARVTLDGGGQLRLAPMHVLRTELLWRKSLGGWALGIAHRAQEPGTPRSRVGTQQSAERTLVTGDEAQRAAAAILPYVNRSGAGRGTVQDAVQLVDEHVREGEDAGALFAAAARGRRKEAWLSQSEYPGALNLLPSHVRLALEMASHEERERRALQGELALLEAAWKDAEALAKIADAL